MTIHIFKSKILPSINNNYVDPITTEIIRNSLNSAAEQMKKTLIRCSFSPIIYEVLELTAHHCKIISFKSKQFCYIFKKKKVAIDKEDPLKSFLLRYVRRQETSVGKLCGIRSAINTVNSLS